MRQQLRRITDRVWNEGSRVAESAGAGIADARSRGYDMARSAYSRGNDAARLAYEYAMNHRKATTAVVLGAGIAAALVWMINRNGGYPAIRRKVLQRVRGTQSQARARRRAGTATQ
jgi:hypothetical protein